MSLEQVANLVDESAFVRAPTQRSNQAFSCLNVWTFGDADEQHDRFEILQLFYAEHLRQVLELISRNQPDAFVLKFCFFFQFLF